MSLINAIIRGTTALLISLLLLSSCGKNTPVPKDIIRKAAPQWAPGQLAKQTGYVVGEALISDGSFGIKEKPVYPIRVLFEVRRDVPLEWDDLTGLPRLPQESETARAYVELQFTENQFGEWSWRSQGKSWIDAEKKPRAGDTQPEELGTYALRYEQAVKNVDLELLERLLEESKKMDEKNGGVKSRETTVREYWVSDVSEMKTYFKQRDDLEEARHREEAALIQKQNEERQRQQMAAQKRQVEEQRNLERILRESREEYKAASAKSLSPVPDPHVEAQVQTEVAEVLRFVSTSFMNQDGHTLDEFLKMKDWAYPTKVHEVVEKALKEAEDQYAARHGNTKRARQEFQEARKQDRARRYRQAEQDPEYRKMKAGQPFENGFRAFHYWMPIEFSETQKRSK